MRVTSCCRLGALLPLLLWALCVGGSGVESDAGDCTDAGQCAEAGGELQFLVVTDLDKKSRHEDKLLWR